MKIRIILCAVTALALSAGTGAYAQGNPTQDSIAQQRGDRGLGRDRGNHQRNAGPVRNAHRDSRANHGPGYDRGNRGGYARDDRPEYGGRGAGPDHSFYRGGRLPPEYRNRSYVVDDWRGPHLSAPPRGYHWVLTGSDYLLVAIATWIIAQILLSQ